MANSEGYHEPVELLAQSTIERHRVIASLQEELEAVDWYDQRVDASEDPSLAALLAHNRDEEKEHAAMNLEWLRRHDPGFDEQLRTYLFTELPVTEVEGVSEDRGDTGGKAPRAPGTAVGGSLGIGSLKGIQR
ncbi:MAG: ferritin-like domain-containing protein [Actinomycetota bacterium]|nr:ferritin-like domain-containing protein [Actinomycetota bacterium]